LLQLITRKKQNKENHNLDNIRTWKPIAGGILSIVAGVIHLFGWLGVGIFLSRANSFFGNDVSDSPGAIIWVFVLPLMILAIVAIVGGIYALLRRVWGLALAGSICAIFSPLTWFLGVIATIFVSISRDEFNHKIITY
jgi:hypothetical protein